MPGVGDINLFGVRDYSMRLWLDPDKMAARNMTAGDVVNAVREQNIQVAAGIVGGPPLPNEGSAFQYTLNAQGRLTEPSEFGDIVVKVGADGRITRLKEIGRVELGARRLRHHGRLTTGILPSRWRFSSCRAPTRSTPPT